MTAVTSSPISREHLVAALHARGLCYLAPTPIGNEPPLSDDELIIGLAGSRDARLRFALAGLLLLHPHLAERVAAIVADYGDALRANGSAEASLIAELKKQYLAAMYLQRMWRTRLAMYLGDKPLIPERYTSELNLPAADVLYGEMGLRALTERSPYNDWSSYEQVVSLLCDQPCATPSSGLPTSDSGHDRKSEDESAALA